MTNEKEYVKIPKKILVDLLKYVEGTEVENETNQLKKEHLMQNNDQWDAGIRNLNDGLSMINTMEDSLKKVKRYTLDLIKILELVSNNVFEIQNVITNFHDLQRKISETVQNTSFNGIYLLNQEQEIKLFMGKNQDDYMIIKTMDLTFNLSSAFSQTKTEIKSYLEKIEEELATVGAHKNRIDFVLDNLIASKTAVSKVKRP